MLIYKCGRDLKVGRHVTLLNAQNLSIGSGCSIDDNTFIDAYSKTGISLGDNVNINKNCYFHCFGKRDGEGIKIGNNVTIGNNTIIYGHSMVTIGDLCAIGPNVVIVPENHKFKNRFLEIRGQGSSKFPINIGKDVWIGAGSVILAGVNIGNGAVIGAGSVVNKNIPPYSLAVGKPARVKLTRS